MIKILWATIRPEMFIDNHKLWMEQADDTSKIETYVAVNNEDQKNILLKYNKKLLIKVIGDNNFGVAKPLYQLTKDLQGNPEDIIIAVFDDVYSVPHWDSFFYNEFKDHNGALYVNDGNQSAENDKDYLITMPVMTFSCLERLNKIIFHPSYNHYFGDDEFTGILRELGVLKDCRKGIDAPTFRHKHSSNRLRQIDEVDSRNYTCLEPDRAVFWIRTGFSLEEKLKV
jgi:hypothetical protein